MPPQRIAYRIAALQGHFDTRHGLCATRELTSNTDIAQALTFDVVECRRPALEAVSQWRELFSASRSLPGLIRFRRGASPGHQPKELNDVGTRLEQVSHRAR
jgi:hypothetical protein